MTTTERPALPLEAEPYVAAVRSLLWSLPADERDELLDDLAAHLAELAAEEGPALRDRLGPPSAYASEFVTSAGVAVDESSDVTRRVRQAVQVPPWMRARLEAFRPAWLVLRPFLIVFGAAALFSGHLFGDVGEAEIVVLEVEADHREVDVVFLGFRFETGGRSKRVVRILDPSAVVIRA